jgi:hypothetical protein
MNYRKQDIVKFTAVINLKEDKQFNFIHYGPSH